MSNSQNSGKRAIVTGASRGIGKEIAEILGQHGFDLVLVARNADDLKSVTQEIQRNSSVECHPSIRDLSKEEDIETLIKEYPEADLLINNAGIATYGSFPNLAWEKEKQMMMLNMFALSRLCHHYLKGMTQRGYGRILNVASTAGVAPIPFMATYASTKAFVIELSKSINLEIDSEKVKDVTVSCLLPGPTATDFWRASNMAQKVEGHMENFPDGKKVAEYGIELMMSGCPSGVHGFRNRLKQVVKHILPETLWGYLVQRHMKHSSLSFK